MMFHIGLLFLKVMQLIIML